MVIFIRERRGNEERSGETSGKIVLALATHSLHKHTNIVDWPIDFKANLTLRKYDHFEHKHLFWTAPPTRPATTPPTRDRCRSPSAEAMPTYRHWACGNYPVSAEMSPYTHGANKTSIITHKKQLAYCEVSNIRTQHAFWKLRRHLELFYRSSEDMFAKFTNCLNISAQDHD